MKAAIDWLKSADRYCFGYGSPTALGLLRMVIGFLAFVNFCMIAVDWDGWFSERGFVPDWLGSLWYGRTTPLDLHGLHVDVPRINLLNGITDPRLELAFYVLVIVAAMLTCIGLWTRFSAFALAIGVVTLHHRNGVILHGGDTVLRVMVIYLAVSPCGQACSVDRLIGLWKGKIQRSPILVSIWAQRLIAFNVSLIYFTTLWLKWDGNHWRNMTATYFPERLPEFYRFWVPDFMKSAFMARITTLGTVMTEFSLGTLVFFPPARKYVLLAGIMMHGYIEYSMNIPLFSYVMIGLYIAYFEGEEISGWAERAGRRLRKWHVVVRLPAGMRFQPRAVAFLDSLDPFKMVAYLPGDAHVWTAQRLENGLISPVKAVGSRSVGAWCFAWIPGAMQSILDRALEPELEPQPEPEPAAQEPKNSHVGPNGHAAQRSRRRR